MTPRERTYHTPANACCGASSTTPAALSAIRGRLARSHPAWSPARREVRVWIEAIKTKSLG